MNSEQIKLDPPGVVVLMTKNERGDPQTSRFTVDLVHLPDSDRSNGFFWAEMEGIMVAWYRQDAVLGWEIHR